MAVPDFQSLMLPLLQLAADGDEHSHAEALEHLAVQLGLTDEERAELLPSGKQPRFDNRVGWAATYLRKTDLLRQAGRGRFQITNRGREVLAASPKRIDLKFLEERFSELDIFRGRQGGSAAATYDQDEGAWSLRPGELERIKETIEKWIVDPDARRRVLEFLAFAVENADEERCDAWYLRLGQQHLKLVTGGLIACAVGRSKLQVTVIGPISDDLRAALAADLADDESFSSIPGSVVLTIPAATSSDVLNRLKDGFNAFVDAAMARLKATPSLEHHDPEAVVWLSSVVARELPQPEPEAETSDDEGTPGDSAVDSIADRTPRTRGRNQLFERGERTIASLMSDVDREVIALPDLQRPFVWEDTKVRNLFDSLFLGYPVGTLVLWHTSSAKDARTVGSDRQSHRPPSLIIDGQQRLTSLFAVMQGRELVGKNGERRRITLAFRPRDGQFEVADAAIRNDPEFLPDVTELWSGKRNIFQITKELLNGLRDKGRVVDDKYEEAVQQNLSVAQAITNYRFPTIDLRETAGGDLEDEDIAEIFVRINNEGKRLGQADFVLTLLSVYHAQLRDEIEQRAQKMSEGQVVGLDTQQLLRAACGVAFNRARMSAVYRYLRGIDPVTRETDSARRDDMVQRLDAAAKECMQETPWRDFLLRVRHAGFVATGLIASKNAIVNAYAFYIRGRQTGVPKQKLDDLASRWLFATLLTARYSGQSETAFEQDLARVAKVDATAFVQAMDEALAVVLTGDYFTHGLIAALETQKARAPSALAFRAAQVVLGARALFSDQLLQNVLDPPLAGGRSASEAHHLFPRDWLERHGVRDRRRINQAANLADVGWHENTVIGAQSPSVYVPRLKADLGIGDDAWKRQCAEHALPLEWETMDYDTFLKERRRRMADVIRIAFRKLGGEAQAEPMTPPWFLPGSETVWRRIAETERALRQVVRDVYVELFGDGAARKIEDAIPAAERGALDRALRSRPAGTDALTVVDYLYLGQLPPLLTSSAIWPKAQARVGGSAKAKQLLNEALGQVAPVRNEIAHVREVSAVNLQRANLACAEILEMLRTGRP